MAGSIRLRDANRGSRSGGMLNKIWFTILYQRRRRLQRNRLCLLLGYFYIHKPFLTLLKLLSCIVLGVTNRA